MIENIFNFLDWEYWSYCICCDLWWWWRWWGWILMLRIFSIQQDWANFQFFLDGECCYCVWVVTLVVVRRCQRIQTLRIFSIIMVHVAGTCGGRWKIGRSGGEMTVVVLEVVFWNVGCVVEGVRKSMCFYEWKRKLRTQNLKIDENKIVIKSSVAFYFTTNSSAL